MIPSPIAPQNLIDLQRQAALGYMGEQARMLLAEGYAVEADQILDDMIARRASWTEGRSGTLDP